MEAWKKREETRLDATRSVTARKAQWLAEEKARWEAEENARRLAAVEARRVAEEQVRRETEDRARRLAEENARRLAEEKARGLAEEKARRRAEEKARNDAEHRRRATLTANLERVNSFEMVAVSDAPIRALPEPGARQLRTAQIGEQVHVIGKLPSGWVEVAREGVSYGWLHGSALRR